MRWDDLNMGDKSRMIQLAVDSGITDLRTIRDVFNSYAEGGHLFETGGPEKQNWFTRATLGAAMADASAVMQASGWDYNENGELEQGDPNAEGPKRLASALELASLAANAPDLMESVPSLAKGAYQAVRHPAQTTKALKTAIGETWGMVKDMNGLVRKGSQFRIVDAPAIEDAIESGLIRSKTGLYHGVPEYLEKTFPEYMKQIKGWQKMTSDEIVENLERLGAFKDMTPKEAFVAKMPIRESTNHGGTVGYFKDTPYPNYQVSKTNYVIETPTSAEHFAPGHHGKLFSWPLDDARTGATVLIDETGNARGASIPAKGSSYWEYSPFWEMWKNKKFKEGGKIHIKPENHGTLFAMGGKPKRRKTLITELPEVTVTPQWLSYWDATPEQTRTLTNRNGKYNTTSMGDKGYTHFDTISARYKGLNAAMQRANFSDEEMSRLSPFLLTQLALEGGWVVDRPDNNFGGMMSNDKRIEFDTEDSFYDSYLKNLNAKWGDEYLGEGKGWRNAKTINEYADTINREDLGLHTKEAFEAYNRKHRDRPAYIYTPLWENNNTGLMDENKFGGIYDRALGNYELLMKRMEEWDKFARNNKIFAK